MIFSAEIVVLFLILVFIGNLAHLDPHGLTYVPPLDLLKGFGTMGTLLADYLAYAMLFAAYEVLLLSSLSGSASLLGETGRQRVRAILAHGRDRTGLEPMLMIVAVLVPAIAATLVARDVLAALPRLLFVATLLVLTAAETIRPFSFGDASRGMRSLGSGLQELTNSPGSAPTPSPNFVPDPPTSDRPSRPIGGDGGWFGTADGEVGHSGGAQ